MVFNTYGKTFELGGTESEINLKLNVDAVCSDPKVVALSNADNLKFSTVMPRWGTEILKAIPSDDKLFIAYENSFHDILNDVEKEKAFEDIYQFIKEKIINP
jgi:esterase/lipase